MFSLLLCAVIPPEILKRGPDAIAKFKKALKDGKEKIPRCKLLILGEQEVGKTSVFKRLVGKGFNPKQERTHGIDDAIVDTIDDRLVSMDQWEVKEPTAQKKQSNELFVSGVLNALPKNFIEQNKQSSSFKSLSEETLCDAVRKISLDIGPKIRQRRVYIRPSTKPEPQYVRQYKARYNEVPQKPEVVIPKNTYYSTF